MNQKTQHLLMFLNKVNMKIEYKRRFNSPEVPGLHIHLPPIHSESMGH